MTSRSRRWTDTRACAQRRGGEDFYDKCWRRGEERGGGRSRQQLKNAPRDQVPRVAPSLARSFVAPHNKRNSIIRYSAEVTPIEVTMSKSDVTLPLSRRAASLVHSPSHLSSRSKIVERLGSTLFSVSVLRIKMQIGGRIHCMSNPRFLSLS